MTKSIMIVGVGGQGTLLASRILGNVLIRQGYDVKVSEVHGMAQRGGCVVSHVRAGDQVFSPMIPLKQADIIIGFEPAEAVRCLPYLKDGGTVIVNRKAVKPVASMLAAGDYDGEKMLAYLKERVKKLRIVDGEDVCRQCGSAKVLNIALLAAAAETGCIGITPEELAEAVKQKLPEKFHSVNCNAIAVVCGKEIQ